MDIKKLEIELKHKYNGPYGCNWGWLAKAVAVMILEREIQAHLFNLPDLMPDKVKHTADLISNLEQQKKDLA